MRPTSILLAGALILMTATAHSAPANEPSGASSAFTSQDPVVTRAFALLETGRFNEAEALLATSSRTEDPTALRARTETADIIRRIRVEYSLDAAGLLANVKKSVPDATASDVDRWAKESLVRHRMIDGQKQFFRRAAQNIFLFCEDAKTRREQAGNAPPEREWKLVDHLKEIVAEADRTGRIEVQPVHHEVTHTLTIPANTPGINTGSLVRAWLPFPQEYRQQRNVQLVRATPEPKQIAPNGKDGNPVTAGAQRTVYFEQRVVDPTKPVEFKLVLGFDSYAYYPRLDEAKAEPLPVDWGGAYLNERPPHLVFTPELRTQVAAIIGQETNVLAKARKIFRWVSANVAWNAEDEYCIIPSLALKGFTDRRGDCGVQSSVLVTMCRIAGIPARWQSGYETKPSHWGMHDWSEIYIAPWGWLPADASYGVQESDDPRIADFYCGHQDSYRMIVNLDWGRELFPPKDSLRSEPADFQRGEVEVDGKNLYFDHWDATTKIERQAIPLPDQSNKTDIR
jgi:transglutaminase-like putative cysteine protease